MKDHKGCKRQFINLRKAWYGKANISISDIVDQVTVGFYHPEGGTTGEFQITWKKLGAHIVPKLEVYDDGWNALFQFGDMLESMADIDSGNINADEFCKLLTALGIEDRTPTEYDD